MIVLVFEHRRILSLRVVVFPEKTLVISPLSQDTCPNLKIQGLRENL